MAEITKWVKKIWKNRTTEFPTRRTLMKEDGSSEIVTVTRNEGTVSEEGDAFDADTMNNLEERIDAGFTEVNGKLIIKDVAVKVLTGYSFIGDAFCENGVTRISGSMSAAAAIKTAEWVKFLQIEDPQFYPTHPSQFPCATFTPGNGAVFAGYINVLTDGGIYVYTRSESIIGSRFFVEFR
jgi:hypothetical protein|nr:MAG TPA: hypothetical protein [Caudoviricetes sp.]